MVPYHIENVHNEPWHIAKVEPGVACAVPRGARPVLRIAARLPRRSHHARNRRDDDEGAPLGPTGRVVRVDAPWGLGVGVDFSGGTGRRAFGHGGMASSRGLADPECGLVMVIVAQRARGVLRRRATSVRDHRRGATARSGDDVADLRAADDVVVRSAFTVDLSGASGATGQSHGDELQDGARGSRAGPRRCRPT